MFCLLSQETYKTNLNTQTSEDPIYLWLKFLQEKYQTRERERDISSRW